MGSNDDFFDASKLTSQIGEVTKALESLYKMADKTADNLKTISKNLDFVKNFKDLEVAQKAVTKEALDATKIASQKAKLDQQLIDLQKAQVKSYENLSINTYAYSFAIKKGMRSYNLNVKYLNQMKNELKNLNLEQKNGRISQEEYTKQSILLKQAISETNITLRQQAKEANSPIGSIDKLSARLGLLKDNQRKMSEEEQKSPVGVFLQKSITEADAAIKQFDASIGNHQRNVGNYEGAMMSLRTEIRHNREELAAIRDATDNGNSATEEQILRIRELEKELGKLVDLQSDINNKAKTMASDTKGIDRFEAGMSTLTGTMQVGKGVMEALGLSTEKFDVAMRKMAGLASINQGLSALKRNLQDGSAFMELFGGRVGKLVRLIRGLSVGFGVVSSSVIASIGAIITYVVRAGKAYDNTRKSIEDTNKKIIESTTLSASILKKQLNVELVQNAKNLKQVNSIAKDYGLTVKELTDSERKRVIEAITAYHNEEDFQNRLHGSLEKQIELRNDLRKILNSTDISKLNNEYEREQENLKQIQGLQNSGYAESVTLKKVSELKAQIDVYNDSLEKINELNKAININASNLQKSNKDSAKVMSENAKTIENSKGLFDTWLNYYDEIESIRVEILDIDEFDKQILKIQHDLEIAQSNIDINRKDAAEYSVALEAKANEEIKKINFEKNDSIIASGEMLLDKRIQQIQKEYETERTKIIQSETNAESRAEKLANLDYETNKKIIQDQIDTTKKSIQNADISAEKRAELSKQLADFEIENARLVTDEEQRQADKRMAIQEALKEQVMQLGQEVVSAVFEFGNMRMDAEAERISHEKELNDAWYDEQQDKLDGAVMSDERRAMEEARIADEKAAKDKQIAQKELELKQRQARWDKAQSLIDVAINTAVAVAKVLAQTGILSPAAIPLIVATGAVQAAVIAAQPIPKYAKGGTGIEGYGIFGEKGAELAFNKQQGVMYADKPTFMNFAPDTTILNALETRRTFEIMKAEHEAFNYEKFGNVLDEKLSKHKSVQNVNLDSRGLWGVINKQGGGTSYINEAIKL